MIGCKKREPGAPSFFVGGGVKRKLPPSRLWRDSSLKEGGCLPLGGRCHRKAMTEGVLSGVLSGGNKIPAGEAQRNFPVPRGHAPHPLPPPAPILLGKRGRRWRGRGRLFYTSHFKGGDGRQWRPSPTEAAAETESPFETPRKSREKVRRNREEVKLPQSRLCRDSPLMEGACLPLWGRWPGGAGPEGVRAGRSRRGIFLSRSVTGPKRFLAS